MDKYRLAFPHPVNSGVTPAYPDLGIVVGMRRADDRHRELFLLEGLRQYLFAVYLQAGIVPERI